MLDGKWNVSEAVMMVMMVIPLARGEPIYIADIDRNKPRLHGECSVVYKTTAPSASLPLSSSNRYLCICKKYNEGNQQFWLCESGARFEGEAERHI